MISNEFKEFKVNMIKIGLGKMIDELISLVGFDESRKIMEELLGW